MKYILVEVDYVSKWVEAVAPSNNEGSSVIIFMKKTYSLDLVLHGLSLLMVGPIFIIMYLCPA